MRDVYTAKLSRLSDEILEMGNLCGQAIMKTCQLLASVEVREAAVSEEAACKEPQYYALCRQSLCSVVIPVIAGIQVAVTGIVTGDYCIT